MACRLLVFLFLVCWLLGMYAVEVALEGIYVSRPEAPELHKPDIEFLKRFGPEAIQAALRVNRGLHEPSLTQHPQVLGNGRLGHPQLLLDVSYGLLGRGQKTENRAAVRFSDDFED